MEQTDDRQLPEVSEREREALHRVELGLEWLRRAHGDLVGFHHKTGHAMDHLAQAETALRDCGREDLADRLRDDCLPLGAVGDRWTYDLLEEFETDFMAHIEAAEERAREEVADGQRHVTERHQQREWRERARDGDDGRDREGDADGEGGR